MAASTTYSTLVADIYRETEDDSPEFIAELPGILARVQDRLQRDLDLDMWHVTDTDTFTSGATTFTIDSTWLRVDEIFITSTGVPLERRDIAFLKFMTGNGTPRYYNRDSETAIAIAPSPSANTAVTIEGIKRMAAISSASPTNWLTNNAADLYLLAALAESERFLKSYERAADYEAQYKARLMEVKRELEGTEASPRYAATAGDVKIAKEG